MKKNVLIWFLCALPMPVIFLLFWFSLWLHLIIFIGGYLGLFMLVLSVEKRERLHREKE